jgi:hypothetical protein
VLTIPRQLALVAVLALLLALAAMALLAATSGTPGNGISSASNGDKIEVAVKSRR